MWYSGFTGLSYFVQTPLKMCGLRFIACMGIGGMWPAGVALVAEAWPDVSRPTLAGLIGTSANIGIAALGIVVKQIGEFSPAHQLTPDSWRWILLLGAVPLLLGICVAVLAPESPQWLAAAVSSRNVSDSNSGDRHGRVLQFRPSDFCGAGSGDGGAGCFRLCIDRFLKTVVRDDRAFGLHPGIVSNEF